MWVTTCASTSPSKPWHRKPQPLRCKRISPKPRRLPGVAFFRAGLRGGIKADQGCTSVDGLLPSPGCCRRTSRPFFQGLDRWCPLCKKNGPSPRKSGAWAKSTEKRGERLSLTVDQRRVRVEYLSNFGLWPKFKCQDHTANFKTRAVQTASITSPGSTPTRRWNQRSPS